MSIRNRINRFMKQRKKAKLKKIKDGLSILAETTRLLDGRPLRYRQRSHKMRGNDGTMYGPFRHPGHYD